MLGSRDIGKHVFPTIVILCMVVKLFWVDWFIVEAFGLLAWWAVGWAIMMFLEHMNVRNSNLRWNVGRSVVSIIRFTSHLDVLQSYCPDEAP
jgi:hypothetical protein